MSNFEFVFSLLAILLGLALAEVLGGLARVVKRKPRLRIGWGMGLLTAWAIFEIVLFWRVAWRSRDNLPDTSPALLAGFAITALYYFAGALLWPEGLERRDSLDEYFMEQKGKVIGALLAANTLAYGLRPLIMGKASWAYMAWFDYASLTVLTLAAVVAIVARRRSVAIGCLAVLVAIDALDPVEAILWPN
jgi:hypothetical protein